MWCGNDRNHDGDLSEDEIAECIPVDGGYLCPLDAVECDIQEKVADCPGGYTYNSTTGKCEYSPAIGVCQSKQIQTENYLCPVDGKIYNDLYTCNQNCLQIAQCVIQYSCPPDFTLSGTKCMKNPDYTITCPSGSTYNSATGKCEANPSLCPPGFRYEYGLYNDDWSCSLGCYAYPICPSPGKPEKGISKPACARNIVCAYKGSSCVSPYTLCKNDRLLCAADPTGEGPWGKTCPDVEPSQGASDYWYDEFWGKCLYQPQPGYSCVYPYSPTTLSVCVYYSHQCPVGSTWVDWCGCYAPPGHYCPPGHTYNPSTGKCETDATVTPYCDVGTYNPSTGKCETDADSAYYCPLGDYPCSGSPPTCQKGETCVTHS